MKSQFDLLKIRLFRRLILSSLFPYLFQLLILIILLILVIIGWQVFPIGVNDKLFAKTNFVTLVIWGIWWPSIIWLTVFLGRIWCAICPLELVSNFSERLGRILGVKQFNINKLLRSGALIVFIYALIQLLISGLHLHRTPAYTSIFLFVLLISSAITGFLFKDRAFCRGFCPISMLLNAYGRGSMLSVGPKSESNCSDCSDIGCTDIEKKNFLDARSCPSLLNPSKLNRNNDCLVCGQCIKSCDAKNLSYFIKPMFSLNDKRNELASLPLSVFIIIVSGFVTYELCTEWSLANSIFLWIPTHIHSILIPFVGIGWIKGFWSIFLFPLILWTIFGLVVKTFTKNESIVNIWKRIAFPAAIIISTGHMIKGLIKFSSWIGYFSEAFDNQFNINLSNIFYKNNQIIHASLFDKSSIIVIGIVLLIIGFTLSIRELKLAIPQKYKFYILPLIIIFVIFSFLVVGSELFHLLNL